MNMKCVLVDVNNKTVSTVEIDNGLESLYEKIGCNLIDITMRSFNGKYHDVVCDDEGLLKDGCIPSAIDDKGNVMLVGNLIICYHDAEGDLTSLTQAEIENVMSCTLVGVTESGMYKIVQCGY